MGWNLVRAVCFGILGYIAVYLAFRYSFAAFEYTFPAWAAGIIGLAGGAWGAHYGWTNGPISRSYKSYQ